MADEVQVTEWKRLSGLYVSSVNPNWLTLIGLDSYIDLRFFKIECLTSILYLWIEFSGVVSRVEVKRKVAIRGKVRRRNGSVRKYVWKWRGLDYVDWSFRAVSEPWDKFFTEKPQGREPIDMSTFGNEIEYATRCRRNTLVPPFHGLRNLGRRAKLKLADLQEWWMASAHSPCVQRVARLYRELCSLLILFVFPSNFQSNFPLELSVAWFKQRWDVNFPTFHPILTKPKRIL